jgi:hypothetical protein
MTVVVAVASPVPRIAGADMITDAAYHRRADRRAWTALVVAGIGSTLTLATLVGWPVLIVIVALLAGAFARAVGAGE